MDRRAGSLEVNGLSLHVKEWGPQDASPIVMLHGIRGYAETFAALAARLVPRFRIIAFDQRGRGDSDWDPARQYYTDQYVADLSDIVDRLGLSRFDLLGHSMGGINAIVYAAGKPNRVRRLVIEDAGPGAFEVSDGAARIRRELAETPASFADWEMACEFMRRLRPTVSEAAREERLQNMLKRSPDGGWTWRYDHDGIAAVRLAGDPARVVDLWPHVRALRIPTLILRGGRSDYLSSETANRMVEANPALRLVEIAEAGHYVHDDQLALTSVAVGDFLTRDLGASDVGPP